MSREIELTEQFIKKLIREGGYAADVLSEHDHERKDFADALLLFVEKIAQEYYDEGYADAAHDLEGADNYRDE